MKTIDMILSILLLLCILHVVGALDNPGEIVHSMDYPGGTRQYIESDGLNWSFVLNEPYNYRGGPILPWGAKLYLLTFGKWKIMIGILRLSEKLPEKM